MTITKGRRAAVRVEVPAARANTGTHADAAPTDRPLPGHEHAWGEPDAGPPRRATVLTAVVMTIAALALLAWATLAHPQKHTGPESPPGLDT